MTPSRSVAVLVLWLAGWGAAMAQAQGPAPPIFTRQAIAAAVAQMGATGTASQDPRHDWSRLRRLEGSEIVLRAQGLSARRCKLLLVDDAALTAVDLENPSHPPLWVPRADVDEVSQWIDQRGSRTAFAVIGAGVGLVAGLLLAQWLAVDGGGRGPEILQPLAAFGTPIAGGFLGYRLSGNSSTLTTIYLRP